MSRTTKAALIATLVGVALLSLGRSAEAVGDPQLEWWSIRTAHFRFTYEKRLEPMALRIARLSEAIHGRLIGPLGHTPAELTEVLLTDDTDSANGSATSLPLNQVRLFITAPGDQSPLGDYDDWYLGLMTHEYTHILHTDNISGVPSLLNVLLGKTYSPNQLQPRWIIEGLAVVAESAYSSGGRIRSTIFDMYLRADVLEDNIAGLDQISSSARRWPEGTLFYLYGSRFLQFVVDVYGQDVLRAVASDYGASIAPWGFNRAIRRFTGRTYVELYEGFKSQLERRYFEQMRHVRVRGLREGKRLTFRGREAFYPRFLPRTLHGPSAAPNQLVYFRDDFTELGGQYRIALDPDRTEELLVRATAESPATWTPEGELIFSSVVPWRRVYRRSDLFTLAPGKTAPTGFERSRKQLTEGLRAREPSVSPDGSRIVFTLNSRGTTHLQIAERGADGQLQRRRTLVPSASYDQVFTPVFSPDGRRVAYSMWTAGGFRDVYVVDTETLEIDRLTNDRSIDANPCWSADGSKLYFTSDRTGIHNVYVVSMVDGRPDGQSLKQVTNVRTGAFMPTVSHDGTLLVYVGYGINGYDLYSMRLDPSRYLEALPPPSDRPQAYPEPPDVPMTIAPYNPLPTLRPYSYTFDYAPGSFSDNAFTLSTAAGDIAGMHGFGLTLHVDVEAPGPQLTFDYGYLELPVDLSVRLANRYTPRSDFEFNDQSRDYVERNFSVRPQVGYTDVREFGNQRLTASYSAVIFDGDLPIADAGPLDPYAQPTVPPPSGYLGTVNFGYSFSTTGGGYDTPPGGSRGAALSLGVSIADKQTLSDHTLLSANYRIQGYLRMPWPGHHVLALRSNGAMSKGTYARRGRFFVGGYNLEAVSLLDAVNDGVFNGAFALRGYPPGSYGGANYILNNFEYRIPIATPDIGPSTLPVYLRRVDGALFVDYGGAFNKFNFDDVEFFAKESFLYSPQLQTSVGAELWLGTSIGYGLDTQFRLGYAYGFSALAIRGGQAYFIASSAF